MHIVLFEDFQCPFCRRFTQELEPTLAREFVDTGDVMVEYRYMAFLGDESMTAAQAAECANQQDYFWPFHDLLYLRQGRENSGAFSGDRLRELGRELGAAQPAGKWDQEAFEACLGAGGTRGVVTRENEAARQLGITSTPTLLVNGRPLVGLPSLERLRKAIVDARPAQGR